VRSLCFFECGRFSSKGMESESLKQDGGGAAHYHHDPWRNSIEHGMMEVCASPPKEGGWVERLTAATNSEKASTTTGLSLAVTAPPPWA
jgi:hypothetical protein